MTSNTFAFSPERRQAALSAMAAGTLDLLVIGGGITGAGVARDAALRGMSVALVEKSDFAAGTSSRSSKIIHGGVRYLEYLQFGLVRESVRERAVLRKIAPHLVHPLPFLYPVWRGESLLKIRIGLFLFDLMAGQARGVWSRRIGPDEVRGLLPGLRDPLKGAVLYREYITDDARFTLANVRSAAAHGSLIANHACAERLLTENGRVVGSAIRDVLSGKEIHVCARVVVNAAGPWVESVFRDSNLEPPARITPSKGIHLLFRRSRLPLEAATFLRAKNGRSGLAMPRGPWVYVGTSDDEYREDLDRPRAEPEEIDELLALAAECFPELALTREDVVATWAGIRPLIHEEGKATRDMSRHDEIWSSPRGLVSVAGGKLTTYRRMAQRVMEAVEWELGEPLPGTDRTATHSLPGSPGEDLAAFRGRVRLELARRDVAEETADRLLGLYGTEIDTLLGYGLEDPAWLAPIAPGADALRGEVRHAIQEEMALTLPDILDRRLALLLFPPPDPRAVAEAAAEVATQLLGWTPERRGREVEKYLGMAREHGSLGRSTPPG